MLTYLLFFILGLIFGSFFNVVGLRVPKKESIVWPGSHCPACGQSLTSIELIPVISYVVQKGKCRRCQTPISPIYPLMELISGILFVFAYIQVGWTAELLFALSFISLLVIIFISDVTYMIIPDKVLIFFAGLFVVERLFIPIGSWWDALLGAAVGFGLLLFIAIVSKGGMGGGDIKLFALLGFALGTKLVLLTLFFATLIGAVFGGIGMLTRKLSKKQAIPFGPFIAIAAIIVYFFGTYMLEWYFQLFIS